MDIVKCNVDFTPTCADCGASDPVWASLNHCVLICSECCFVHRNLGKNFLYILINIFKALFSCQNLII